MRTAVVILNWNTEAYLRSFLPQVIASCPPDAAVIVADSGSTDASLQTLSSEFPSVRVIPLGSNFGFAGGYNRALAQVEAEYYILLNSDVSVEPGWIEPLIAHMDANPGCGVCGPKLHALDKAPDGSYIRTGRFEYAGAAGGLLDRYGYPYCRGRILKKTEEDRGQYDSSPAGVLWVTGACMVTRSSLWKQLGGFDERFFAHMEEIDYCWRVQLLGHSVEVVPGSCVWHLGGGTLAPDSPKKLEFNFRNNLLLLENNLPLTIGKSAARRRITFRMLLDGGSAAVYLLSGRPACFLAVLRAHHAWRELRRGYSASGKKSVAGYNSKTCILLHKPKSL